ncbi:MAG: hypothetical protein E6K40_09565 [Gammaproteobacteria bacterium]|nr:MAG: hypothetical protein E6K40_09565 [Gammaproteobacteria bacterium]
MDDPKRSATARTGLGVWMLQHATGVLAAAVLASQANAAPDAVTYQLQERCGHSAEQWFKRNFREVENTKDGQALRRYPRVWSI